jgi:hypothetical protein
MVVGGAGGPQDGSVAPKDVDAQDDRLWLRPKKQGNHGDGAIARTAIRRATVRHFFPSSMVMRSKLLAASTNV